MGADRPASRCVDAETVEYKPLPVWKVPSPLLSAVATPLSPKPTMSARPSPVRSARNRGC